MCKKNRGIDGIAFIIFLAMGFYIVYLLTTTKYCSCKYVKAIKPERYNIEETKDKIVVYADNRTVKFPYKGEHRSVMCDKVVVKYDATDKCYVEVGKGLLKEDTVNKFGLFNKSYVRDIDLVMVHVNKNKKFLTNQEFSSYAWSKGLVQEKQPEFDSSKIKCGKPGGGMVED